MPPPALQSVIKQTGGFIWHAGTSVNAVLTGVPGKHRQAVANGCSDWLVRQGFGVDPQAKIKLELTITQEGDGEMVGKNVPQDQLTPAMRKYLQSHPHEKWVEMVKVKNIAISGKVYDSAGKPVFQLPKRLVSRAMDKGGNDDPVWQGLATWKDAPNLPKTYFLDSTGKRVFLPSKYIQPGIDGLIDAVIDSPEVGDEFQLPEQK